ncbi:MAG: hypothetical protein R3F19_16780 [Verrucomicrobiales bacterium]
MRGESRLNSPVLVFVVEPATWHWRNRREALTMLSAAKTTNELQQAVGGLGIFIPLRDGSWIAIRYRDTHAGRIESLAVARDSGESWFESDHHFCGAFSAYAHDGRLLEEIRSELAKLGERDTNTTSRARSEIFVALDAVFDAPSLEVGRQQLLKLGFEPLTK